MSLRIPEALLQTRLADRTTSQFEPGANIRWALIGIWNIAICCRNDPRSEAKSKVGTSTTVDLRAHRDHRSFGMAAKMIEINEILKNPDAAFNDRAVWHQLDALIEALPVDQRFQQWAYVAQQLEARNVPVGHAHLRLGILHLINDSDESRGIQHLEKAYEQDQIFSNKTEPYRMAAYRVLGLIKDFLDDLRAKKSHSKWQMDQLLPPGRRVLITTLLAVYDESTKHILDAPVLTYQMFFALFGDKYLTRFAAQNYYCAHGLLEMVMVQSGQGFLSTNEYGLARALVGLYGGVLEAILADKLGIKGHGTLGEMVNRAHDTGLLNVGTRLCALATVVLYFRNHVHANKDIARKDYFIDINVARSLKAATDWVIIELVKLKTAVPSP